MSDDVPPSPRRASHSRWVLNFIVYNVMFHDNVKPPLIVSLKTFPQDEKALLIVIDEMIEVLVNIVSTRFILISN